MDSAYKVVYEGGTGEIVEKKSRFIATVFSVASEEEAASYIEQMKKKYWDARHNCYAYIIGKNGEKQKCSDDGEPQGTAGRPMLDVLLGEDIKNILVVVTRYFGGTLLGTGGLVRAYSAAAKKGIEESVIVDKSPAVKMRVVTDYNGIGKLQYIAGDMDIHTLDTEYGEKVTMTMLVPHHMMGALTSRVMEATSAAADMIDEGEVWYAMLEDKSIHIFE